MLMFLKNRFQTHKFLIKIDGNNFNRCFNIEIGSLGIC